MGPDSLRLERLLRSVLSPGVPLLRHEDGMSDTRQASCFTSSPSPPRAPLSLEPDLPAHVEPAEGNT